MEKPTTEENIYIKDSLAAEAYDLRNKFNHGDINALISFQDRVADWDTELKKELNKEYGSTRPLQQVPGWQALIGGTLEPRTDISDELYNYIEDKVREFIKIESKNVN